MLGDRAEIGGGLSFFRLVDKSNHYITMAINCIFYTLGFYCIKADQPNWRRTIIVSHLLGRAQKEGFCQRQKVNIFAAGEKSSPQGVNPPFTVEALAI